MKSRVDEVRKRLETAFAPNFLDVIDESHLHHGHSGSRDGAGHYAIVIQSHHFDGLSRIQAHQKVYDTLRDMIPTLIHALRIQVLK